MTKTKLIHSIYMHKAHAYFMLIRETRALVYLCVALPATQCIALQDFSCSEQNKRNADL